MRPRVLTNLLTMRQREQYWIGALLSFGTGLMQFFVFFPDNEPGIVFLLVGVVSILGGVVLGVLVPGVWFLFCAAACWGSTLAGVGMILAHWGRYGFYLISVGIATALLGGAIGAVGRSQLNRMYESLQL